ncbi:hypothetical protein PG984_002300 [Apiospora sp. TS-2023a]
MSPPTIESRPDEALRSEINAILIHDGTADKIREQFLHSLNSHPSNWPSAIEAHALSLLRSGEATTFPALINRVLEDVRQDTALAAAAEEGKNGEANGTATNGNNKKAANGTASDANKLAIPATVVQDLLRVTREHLDEVVYVEDEEAS